MIIVTEETTSAWLSSGVVQTVETYFATNSGTWIAACVTATNLTYQQVAWALAYAANGKTQPLLALPESDSDLPLAIQLNAMWGS